MDEVISKNGVPIRLTQERWFHILENHDDMAGYYDEVLQTVEKPDYIVQGYRKAVVALKTLHETMFLAVVYKEIDCKDGFIITAYQTSKVILNKEIVLWRKG